MKKIVLLVASLLILTFSSLSLAEVKIGVVDVNRVLANIPQIKNLQANLKKQFEPRGRDIAKLQNTFRGDVDSYKKNNAIMSPDVLKKEQQRLVAEDQKLRESQANFQRDLVAARNKALQPILQKIESVVGKIAKDQKFDLVVTKVSLAYNAPQFEITDQVIAEMKK